MTDEQTDEHEKDLSRSERLLTEIPGAKTTEERADTLFESAWDEVGDRRQRDQAAEVAALDGRRSESASRIGRRALVFVALASVLGVWWVITYQSSDSTEGVRPGEYRSRTSPPDVELVARTRPSDSDAPGTGTRLTTGARLEPGDRISFHYRLSRAKPVALLVEPDGRRIDEIWRGDGAIGSEAAEIQSGGRTLTFDPSVFEGTFRFALVAGEHGQLDDLATVAELTPGSIGRVCSTCGVDTLQLRAASDN